MPDISAKIAQLVSSSQVAFNVGSAKGVAIGDTATAYRDVTINDPDSKEPLGAVRVPRLTFRISFVQEKFCIGEVQSADNIASTGGLYLLPAFGSGIRLTTSPVEVRSGIVLVKIGEELIIRTAASDKVPDEPPF